MIGGWEVGVSTMQPGELATLTCGPQYAYGEKGIPPMIPPSATLQFEVELLTVEAPESEKGSLSDFNEAPRTPAEISAAYQQKMAAKASPLKGLEGVMEWAKGIYIFGLFSSGNERCALRGVLRKNTPSDVARPSFVHGSSACGCLALLLSLIHI